MESDDVKNLIKSNITDAQVLVDGEGCNFSVVVVSDEFEGLSLLQKQQKVMAAVKAQIASGELHAITVKAYTPREWSQQSNA